MTHGSRQSVIVGTDAFFLTVEKNWRITSNFLKMSQMSHFHNKEFICSQNLKNSIVLIKVWYECHYFPNQDNFESESSIYMSYHKKIIIN